MSSVSLGEKLKAVGYVKGKRLLTPIQVRLIVSEFGEPEFFLYLKLHVDFLYSIQLLLIIVLS